MNIRIKYIFLLIAFFSVPGAAFAQQSTSQDYFNAGLAQTTAKDYPAAIKSYTECLRLDGKSAACYGNRGYVYLLNKDYSSALADFNQALILSPQLGNYYYFRARTLLGTGKLDPALADLNKSLELGFKNTDANFRVADVYKWRGYIFATKGDTASALQNYAKMIELVPNEPAFYNLRGVLYITMGDNKIAGSYDSALKDFNQAISLNSKYADAFANRATVYGLKNDNETALADCNTAIQLAPENANYYLQRGTVYFRLEKYDAALTDFNQSIELNPKNSLAYNIRGITYLIKENRASAIADFQKSLELDPNNSSARSNLQKLTGQTPNPTANPVASQNNPPVVLSDADRYNKILQDLAAGKTVSDTDIKWALQYEKNHPKKP